MKISQVLLISNQPNWLFLPKQDRDFCLLHPEDPLFQTFSGETLRYKGHEPLYPFFINECAYYEKGIALSLARKRRVVIPAIRVQTEQEQQDNEQGFASEEEEWGLFKTPDMMRLMWGWNKFYKKFTFIEMTADAWNTHVYARIHSHTQYLSVQLLTVLAHNWRMNNTFTVDSQKHSHTVTFAVIFTLQWIQG